MPLAQTPCDCLHPCCTVVSDSLRHGQPDSESLKCQVRQLRPARRSESSCACKPTSILASNCSGITCQQAHHLVGEIPIHSNRKKLHDLFTLLRNIAHPLRLQDGVSENTWKGETLALVATSQLVSSALSAAASNPCFGTRA